MRRGAGRYPLLIYYYSHNFFIVLLTQVGFEPLIFGSRIRRSTNWALDTKTFECETPVEAYFIKPQVKLWFTPVHGTFNFSCHKSLFTLLFIVNYLPCPVIFTSHFILLLTRQTRQDIEDETWQDNIHFFLIALKLGDFPQRWILSSSVVLPPDHIH